MSAAAPPRPARLALLLSIALLTLSAGLAGAPASAGAAPAPAEVHPGHYSGGGFPSTPIEFGVTADRKEVERLTTRIKLDCKHGGAWVGELTVKRVVFVKPIPIVSTTTGGRFSRNTVVRFTQGGKLRVTVHGKLLAPERAKGTLTGHARLPGDITCKPFFGPIRWTARYVGHK
ncbi:MAG: hypothetical protein ACM3NV_04180 [Syntrophothermus sp.]